MGRGAQMFLYSLGRGPQPQTLKTPGINNLTDEYNSFLQP